MANTNGDSHKIFTEQKILFRFSFKYMLENKSHEGNVTLP